MNDILYFYDPKHGNCLRTITKVDKNTYIINGAYGSDEGGKGHWAALATKEPKEKKYKNMSYNLIVDFKYKKKITHVPKYHALWKGRKIHWEDGNTWLQLYA
jgi:hypothetical protein